MTGALQDVLGQQPDIIGHGCREQQRLALSGHVPDDLPDIGQEAHIEHPVRLVQYEYFQVRQVDRALMDVIEQAAGTGHDDFYAGSQSLFLRVYGHAPVNRDAAQARLAAQIGNGSIDLLCQFAGRRNDEGADTAARPFYQALENRQHKGRCFACSRLGKAHDVVPLHDRRDGLVLDGRRRVIAERCDAGCYLWMEIERIKTHVPFFL